MRPKASIPDLGQAAGASRTFAPELVFSRDDMSGGQSGKSHGQLILIVEDDYLIALDLEAGLHAAGFDVAGPATSADEAISFAHSVKPALVLMDIRLLGARDGIDAALELYRELGTRCIFTTAHGDRNMRLRADAAMPLGWVQKPYSIATVVSAVRDAFQELKNKR